MGTCSDLFTGDRIGWYPPSNHGRALLLGRVACKVPRGVLVEWDNETETVLRDHHFSRGWARVESDQLTLSDVLAGGC